MKILIIVQNLANLNYGQQISKSWMMTKKASFQVFDADHSGELDFAEFVKVPRDIRLKN